MSNLDEIATEGSGITSENTSENDSQKVAHNTSVQGPRDSAFVGRSTRRVREQLPISRSHDSLIQARDYNYKSVQVAEDR
jgi:hypothetical protein